MAFFKDNKTKLSLSLLITKRKIKIRKNGFVGRFFVYEYNYSLFIVS
jgi:hypothetical protein